MSDVMLFGVLGMPYDMAMGDEFSRRQFYDRVQEALPRLRAASREWTDEELTAIYKRANGEDNGKAKPLTTANIFRAMRAMTEKQ